MDTGHRKAGSYVVEIDALRCFAMLGVMILHVGLLPFGWIGVWLFFVISGFAITRSLSSDQMRALSNGEVLRSFFIKRALRILPLYFFYLLLVYIYVNALNGPSISDTLRYLLSFTYNIATAFDLPGVSYPGVAHLWSISGEEQFYIAFPFLFVFLTRRNFALSMLLVLAISPLLRLWLGGATAGGPESARLLARQVAFFTPAHFDAFAIGALVAIIPKEYKISRKTSWLALLSGFAVLATYCATYTFIQLREGLSLIKAVQDIVSGDIVGQYREVFCYTALWGFSASLIIAILGENPVLLLMCKPRLFKSMGRPSYGGYVYHGFVIDILSRWSGIDRSHLLGKVVFLILLVPLSMTLAWMSFNTVERFFLKMKPAMRTSAASSLP